MNDIILSHIKKDFHHQTVLEVPDFRAEQGQIISLVGNNGAGKSTFIKLIAGLFLQDQGQVTVLGVSNRNRKIHSLVRFVLESGQGLYHYLTSIENIHYFLGLNQLSLQQVQEELDFLFDCFHFTSYKDVLVSELSQGNRQKLALILALVQKPQVLCLDEPTNGLDLVSKKELTQLLKDYAQQHQATIFITSHDASFIEQVSQRVLVLDKGQIRLDAPFDTIFGENSRTEIYKLTLAASSEHFIQQTFPQLAYSIQEEQLLIETRDQHLYRTLLETAPVLSSARRAISMEELLYEVLS